MKEMKEGSGCFAIIMAAIILLVTIAFCEIMRKPLITIEPEIIQLEQVMEHSPTQYSIKYRAADDELITMDLGWRNLPTGAKIKIIADAPADQQIWISLSRAQNNKGETLYTGGEIHIHSAREINGGGWDFGKGGKGQTNVVESQ